MSEEVPKKGLGGVVVNEGPDFHVEVRYDLDVPEPRKSFENRPRKSSMLIESRG